MRAARLVLSKPTVSVRARSLLALFMSAPAAFGCGDPEVLPLPPGSLRSSATLSAEDPAQLDLLVVVDDSRSADDERPLFADALAELLLGLVRPPDAQPLSLQVGFLRTSMGSGPSCPKPQHQGRLARQINWDPVASDRAPTDAEARDFAGAARRAVLELQDGCGFEAPLEAWYRFLVDPEPKAELPRWGGSSPDGGIDSLLLEQRSQFLRPHSQLIIALLSDENDCSLRDDEPAAKLVTSATLPPPTSACALDPDDPCCRSCGVAETEPPLGCAPLKLDPGCQSSALDWPDDTLELRCFEPKRRYGIDALHPVSRYVAGLSERQIETHGGVLVDNPLFTGKRDPASVSLAAVLGVPWQDLSYPSSFADPDELSLSGVDWELALGDPEHGVPPSDPFQLESHQMRSGFHPLTGDRPAKHNAINGGDVWYPGFLQRACSFPLPQPQRDGCRIPDDPACRNPETGAYGPARFFGHAQPSLRQLQVLREVGRTFVGSACAKRTDDPSLPSHGYRAVTERLLNELNSGPCGGRCFSELVPRSDRRVPCRWVEALPHDSRCACEGKGRKPLEARLRPWVEAQLDDRLEAGGCLCELEQLEGDALNVCQTDPASYPANESGELVHGWCYVAPNRGAGSFAVTNRYGGGCDHTFRVVGDARPDSPARYVLLCNETDDASPVHRPYEF